MNTEPVQYIIWNPEGRTPPTVRFNDEAKAIAEAERLAARHAGQSFYICQLRSVSRMGPVATQRLQELPVAAIIWGLQDLVSGIGVKVGLPAGKTLTNGALVEAFARAGAPNTRMLALDGCADLLCRAALTAEQAGEHHVQMGSFSLMRQG